VPQNDSKSYSGLEQQNAQIASNPYPRQLEDDSINFYELWITLWKRKWVVFTVTVVSALWSVVYALQLQNVYKAEALLLPPKEKKIRLINIDGILDRGDFDKNLKVVGHSAGTVFSMFIQNINSRTLHKKFIQEKGLKKILAPDATPETSDPGVYMRLAGLIKLNENKGMTSLSIEFHDGDIAAQWVNDLIEFVDKETIAVLVEDTEDSIANQIRDIEYTIASKRQMAKKRREDTILQYEEASIIATKLGVVDRVDSTNIVQNNQLNISTTNVPLYFRGYRALNAEISFLKNRISDDPFISGLRDLQERLALLRSIKFDIEKMSAVYIDQPAYTPNSPIKPNRKYIVSLATVFGLFLGILLAFLIEFTVKERKKHLV